VQQMPSVKVSQILTNAVTYPTPRSWDTAFLFLPNPLQWWSLICI
jgi:hypothetical protein